MTKRCKPRQDGFSFVELLVTIIIAGIAFAAMVPLFISAQQATASDQLRNSALQLAQDKLEKIRALDYDLITVTNLNSSTFASGQFGTSVQWPTGGGATRTFAVAYSITLLPLGSQNGQETYKQVTVTVTWTAPPSPVKPAVLSTMISKQYAGPQIIQFNVGPTTIMQQDATTGGTAIVSGPVVLDAYISPDDIASMNQSASLANQGYVLFTISSLNGTTVASQKVTTPVSGEPAHYQFTWDNSQATDGTYIFQAVAVAGFGSRAQGMPVSIAMQYTNHAPPPPGNLTATAGNQVVTLQWTAPAAGDLADYEVWRSTDGQTYTKLTVTPDAQTTSYSDTNLTNGVTYYYRVYSVDTEGLYSVPAQVSATPAVPVDTVPPSVPTGLAAAPVAGQPTIELTWNPSTDFGTPASGVAGYTIERSANGTTNWTTLATLYQSTVYDDTTAGWGATWYYHVKAVDVAQNSSAWTSPVSATTPPKPVRSIAVTNNSSLQTYVWVQSPVSYLWYSTTGASSVTCPSGQWVKKNGNTVTWTNLPPGIYNIYFRSGSSWSSSTLYKSQAVDVTSGNGTATYP